MASNPAFELFEQICEELSAREATVLPEDDLDPAVIEDLKDYYDETAAPAAFRRALGELREHFDGRGSQLPFEFNEDTGDCRAVDKTYIDFISFASNGRGVGGDDAKGFELQTLERLSKRVTGVLHRVGHPRDHHRKKPELVKYLCDLGFDKNCLEKKDRDGGLDLLWLPPLGAVPLRPVVSLQCKNSSFNEAEANESAGRALRTLQRHSHIRGHHHLVFVIFNDYIDESFVGRAAGWIFIPLGLSDLAALATTVETHVL